MTPVSVTAFDLIRLRPFKVASMAVASRELLKIGDPVAEAALSTAIIRAVARHLDEQLLSPAITEIAGTRPASVTNDDESHTSTGSSAAQIAADLAAMIAKLGTEGPFVWTMRPSTLMRIALAIPGIVNGRTLLGAPVTLSPFGPAQITLLDPSEILYALDENSIQLDVAREASILMDDGEGTPSTTVVNLFADNLIGLRASVFASWLRARDGAVVSMAVSY
jgi:HK97 family phage major capsid protein